MFKNLIFCSFIVLVVSCNSDPLSDIRKQVTQGSIVPIAPIPQVMDTSIDFTEVSTVSIDDSFPYFIERPEVFVYKGLIWVMGGTVYDPDQNRQVRSELLYVSNDGINWIKAGNNTLPTGISYRSHVVWQNLVIIAGKYENTIPPKYTAEVWVSEDLLNWSKLSLERPFTDLSGPLLFPKNDYLYLLGGTTSRRVQLFDSWRTQDLVTWEKLEAPNDVFLYSFSYYETSNGYFKITNSGTLHATDGINWSTFEINPEDISDLRITNEPGGFFRSDFGVVTLNDELFIFGGKGISTDYYSGYYNDVWKSADGYDWELIVDGYYDEIIRDEFNSFPARSRFSTVVFKDTIFMFGGSSGTQETDTWVSPNGVDWYQYAKTE
jgi:hypothetical protein